MATIDFTGAIEDLGGAEGVFEIGNEARAPSDYLLATILPERLRPGHEATAGSMTVRGTMADMVGMDSKYPEGGAITLNSFREQITKLAIQATLTEAMQNELQGFFDRLTLDNGNTREFLLNTVLNFVQKLLLQPHFDRDEWMRGQALFTGEIDWTSNGIPLKVNYGIPAANLLPTRTGTAGYGGSASTFWADWKTARRRLRNNIRAAIGNTDMIDAIVYNEANTLEVIGQTDNTFRIRRLVGSGVNQRPSTNATEIVDLIAYDGQGEVRDPADPSRTVKVDFIPAGTLGIFGRNEGNREFRIDQGATDDPNNNVELGWTQVGPTNEGGGRLGTWMRVYTPEAMPMQIRGQSVRKTLPVVRNPDKIVILSSEVA